MKEKNGLSRTLHRSIYNDHRKAARVAKLVYTTDTGEGIRRTKKGKSWSYIYKGKPITSDAELTRIRKLAIPPSWSDVWICPKPAGHIQATGIDLNGRKQYRYHARWNELRNETKFHRLLEFGKALPSLRKKVKADIKLPTMTAEKVLATAISLMEETYIRVGNNGYEKLYGSYGITTLKDRHVTIGKGKVVFSFTGKKGIDHNIVLRNSTLARILKQCRDIPGKELFQYYDHRGKRKSIDSGMVNNYIKEATKGSFSAKDFRTWAGSRQAIESFKALELPQTATDVQKNILSVLDQVSAKLGNSRNICKKYYVHPGLISMYEQNKLTEILQTAKTSKTTSQTGLSPCEKLLMVVLKKCT